MNYSPPPLKKIKEIFLKNEDKIVLICGFILVSLINFGIGRLSVEYKAPNPPIIIDDRAIKCNNSEKNAVSNGAENQSAAENKDSAPSGKVIGNKKSLIYHLPEGKFYNTILEENRVYFTSEEEAKKAGYRKSKL